MTRSDDADDGSLEPSTRVAAHLAPPLMCRTSEPAEEAPQAQPVVPVEEMLKALVRRVAWSGNGRRGTVRLELADPHAGTIVVEAEGGRAVVRVGGAAEVGWRERMARRLRGRGLEVELE